MRIVVIALMVVILADCTPPVLFSVDVDEPVVRGRLTLNGHSAELMKNVDGAYWGKWNGSDADGSIDLVFPDGATLLCKIGYVTHGMPAQKFVVRKRKCQQAIDR